MSTAPGMTPPPSMVPSPGSLIPHLSMVPNPNMIHFAAPIWLAVGLLLSVALIVLEVRVERQRRKALNTFSSRGAALISSLSPMWRLIKAVLTVTGVALICGALARPQSGYRVEETYRRGLDLMFVLDTSKSMLTPDLKPSRLVRARLALDDLVSKFEGDRIGLVAFAGDAFLEAPLTLDHAMFEQTLDAVDTSTIPRGGTDIGRAIRVAVDALHSQPANRKLLVLLTDGEDLEAKAVVAAREAAGAGVRIYTVGVGTPGGELIPLPGGGFVKDASGAFVQSRLDEKMLAEIAGVTGGQSRALGPDGHGLELLYQDVLAKLPQDTVGERLHRVPLERFQWPLGLAAICLALEALLQERRRRRPGAVAASSSARPFHRGRGVMTGFGMILALGFSHRALASVGQAEEDYRSGKFPQAADEYRRSSTEHPEDPRLHLNAGAATYKSGDYKAAANEFQGALHSDRLDLQQRAYYDLGNSQYRTGEKTVQAEPAQTIEQWKQAVTSYDGALKLNPKDDDAIFNRDFVRRKLAELERQQQSKKDQKQQRSEQQKKSDQGKQDKDKSGQGQQAQNQSGQGKQDQNQSDQGKQDQDKSGQNQQAQNQQGQGKQDQDKSGQSQQGQDQSGKQDQDKSGQGQQARNQQGQGKQDQDKSGQGQQAQDKSQQAQNQDKQDQSGKSDQPASTGTPTQQNPTSGEAEKAEEAAKPGELSRAGARALLDSLRGDERVMTAGAENVPHTDDEQPTKDW